MKQEIIKSVQTLWKNKYQNSVDNHLLTKLEALFMISNELHLQIEYVKK